MAFCAVAERPLVIESDTNRGDSAANPNPHRSCFAGTNQTSNSLIAFPENILANDMVHSFRHTNATAMDSLAIPQRLHKLRLGHSGPAVGDMRSRLAPGPATRRGRYCSPESSSPSASSSSSRTLCWERDDTSQGFPLFSPQVQFNAASRPSGDATAEEILVLCPIGKSNSNATATTGQSCGSRGVTRSRAMVSYKL
jgi:hypothetical protein